MTRDETKMLVLAIVSIYPNWKPQDLTFTVDTWAMMLEDEDVNEMQMALKSFALTDTKGFAPSIGQLKEHLYNMTHPAQDDSQYRKLIVDALHNGYYHATECWEKFPEELKKALQPQEIRDYSIQQDLNVEYLISNIMKRVESIRQTNKELKMLPPRFREMIAQAQNKMLEAKT